MKQITIIGIDLAKNNCQPGAGEGIFRGFPVHNQCRHDAGEMYVGSAAC